MDSRGTLSANQKAKLQKLRALLASLPGAIVAYSGGVDSTLLLAVASDVLPGRVIAVTASSPTYPPEETQAAVEMATALGVPVNVIETQELSDPHFSSNPRDRCYHCKRELARELLEIAEERAGDAVLDGSNFDDVSDDRPGIRAGREAGVRSLLMEAEMTKADVRAISRYLGLRTFDKPSQACLASRVPYSTPLTAELLEQIAGAERALRRLGLRQVRVRYHGPVARVEVDTAEMPIAFELRDRISRQLTEMGFVYVALDLAGYRSGSSNEVPEVGIGPGAGNQTGGGDQPA